MLKLVYRRAVDPQRIDYHVIGKKFDEIEAPECRGILVLKSAVDL